MNLRIHLFLVLLLPCVLFAYRNFGPSIPATEGEPWPSPWIKNTTNESLFLQPVNFVIETIDKDCEILNNAVQRYLSIIFIESNSAGRFTHGKEALNPSIKGNLTRLIVQKLKNCETMPYFQMDESYILEIVEDECNLSADSVWGALRGLETFSQLLSASGKGNSLKIKKQIIKDKPRLPHRGLLLDTSRHFLSVKDIFLTLDAMSYNKLNVFHWHIVDDNSFPFKSTTFPELSLKGAYHPSMIYTRNDIQRVVNYARLRGIRVIPEFDTPGHTESWGQGYPDLLIKCHDENGNSDGTVGPLDPTNPKVYEFLHKLYHEIVDLFPEKYLHLGGDEVPFKCWESNSQILDFMKHHNMTRNFTQLQNFYISKLLNITRNLNSKTIVWQEVFDNGIEIEVDTIVQVWIGPAWKKEISRITKAGNPVLLSTCWYLNNLLSGGDWKKFYYCDPLLFSGSEDQKKLVLGGEACMWGEYVDRNNLHQRIWPRASAAAERLWSFNTQPMNFVSKRLEEHSCRMNKRGVPAQPPNGSGFCLI